MCVKMHIVNEDSPCYVTPFAPKEVHSSLQSRKRKKIRHVFWASQNCNFDNINGNHMREMICIASHDNAIASPIFFLSQTQFLHKDANMCCSPLLTKAALLPVSPKPWQVKTTSTWVGSSHWSSNSNNSLSLSPSTLPCSLCGAYNMLHTVLLILC